MKTKYFFLSLFMIASLVGYSQEETLVTVWGYNPFIVNVSLCNEFKHVYVNLEPPQPLVDDGIEEVEFSLVDRPTERYRVPKGPNGFEANFYNIHKSVRSDFNVRFLDRDRNEIAARTISPTPRQAGMVTVSAHLNAMLDRFTGTDEEITHFFCNQTISEIELIGFFQEFLGLNEDEMCAALLLYNIYFAGTSGVVDEHFVSNLCDEFADFIEGEVGNDDPGNDNPCLCNMIQTNRVAHNATSIPVLIDPEDQCNDYQSWKETENAEYDDDDDNLIFTQGRLGVARGSALVWNYDGGDDSPDPFVRTIKPSWSQVAFKMVCIDPATISPNLDNCSTCKKEVTLKYAYYSHARIKGEKDWHISGSEIGWRSEDWAVMTVQNGSNAEVVNSFGKAYILDCDLPDDHPSISETLTDAGTIVNSVTDLIGDFTVGGLIETGIEVIDYIETHITSQFCNQDMVYDTVGMSGELVYELLPGDQFTAVMVSGGSFSGKVANNGRGFFIVNTDGFVTAVAETLPAEDGTVPDYCECERIGTYALGSLGNTTPPVPHIWGDPNRLNFMPPATVFDKVPRGIHNLKEEVGIFLGLNGPWNPKYQSIGCCSPIYPKCLSECIYLKGCDLVFGLQGVDSGYSFSPGSTTADLEHLQLYPNPVAGGLLYVDSPLYEEGATLQVYNLMGQLQHATQLKDAGTIRIDTRNWKAGLYSVVVSTEDGQILHQDKVVVMD